MNFLIAGGVAASAAYNRANAPYCEPCQRWYEQHQHVQKTKHAYKPMLRPDEARGLVSAFAASAPDKQPG